MSDFMNPDRIAIGSDNPQAAALVSDLHAGIDAPVVVMDVRSEEMVKLASNALLATTLDNERPRAELARQGTGTSVLSRAGRDR
ncbi:hypothetical protein [Streptomyces sp. NBC_00239]|uniref:hypothetical protein n=1 Tax=Streptomyces sp. NBC_00239 TaxID=2903640 RepID=UPI002E2B573C|nr:hypothetical protein [Streptomyces sp. NBC_00239]